MSQVAGYRRLVNNASAVLVGRLAAIAFSVALATVLFRSLGPERYGQWALLTLLAGYSTLIDFGLSSAVERRVASLVARSADALIPATLNSCLTAVLIVVAVAQVLVIGVLALPAMASIEPGTRRALLALPLCSGMTLCALSTGAVLAGQQRLIALYAWRTIGLAAGTGAVVGAVTTGISGLDVLLFLYTVGSVLTFVLVWFSIRRTIPALSLRLELDRASLRDLLVFGGVVQFATMVPPLAEYAFRLIVSARFGLAFSGVYDLGARAAMVPRSLAGSLFAAMIPFAVQTERQSGPAGLDHLVRTTARHVALFMLPATAVLVAFSEPLVRLWLGPTPLQAAVRLCFQLLLVAHAFGALAVPAAMVGRATGRPAAEALTTAAAFVIAVILANFVPSFPVATVMLWGLPAVGGFVCWLALSRLVNVSFVQPRDAVATAAAATVAFLVARALLPAGDAPLLPVLGRLSVASLAALGAAGLVELGVRRSRVQPSLAPGGEGSR